MKILDFKQGSEGWLAHRANHFNASDAPAMLGESPYKTRSQLLHEYATGITAGVDADTQRRFDEGHRAEALARPLAEAIIGEDLYPVTGSSGPYSASFDGLTMGENIAFEHKSLNNEIRACQSAADLPAVYRIQMEQQLMVSGAEKCLFMATRWAGDELLEKWEGWYTPDFALRTRIVHGWEQFKRDMASYKAPEVIPATTATPTKALPSVSIQVNGSISLASNLDIFGAQLKTFISEINTEPTDDQGFADAEAAIKTLEKAQTALETAEAAALAQTASIDDMRRTVAHYVEQARTTRLMLEKMVKSRKEAIRLEIVNAGKAALTAHIAALNTRLGRAYMPQIAADFAGVIKGKRTLSSLRDAVDTELARAKIEANAVADNIQINLIRLQELAANHAFLFADAAQLVLKAPDDLTVLAKARITEHQAAEQKRLDAERERIRQEEAAKLQKEAESKAPQPTVNMAAEYMRQNPPPTTGMPNYDKPKVVPGAKGPRPTDDNMIRVLALHYRVHESKVIEWLLAMDLDAASKRMAREFAA